MTVAPVARHIEATVVAESLRIGFAGAGLSGVPTGHTHRDAFPVSSFHDPVRCTHSPGV